MRFLNWSSPNGGLMEVAILLIARFREGGIRSQFFCAEQSLAPVLVVLTRPRKSGFSDWIAGGARGLGPRWGSWV